MTKSFQFPVIASGRCSTERMLIKKTYLDCAFAYMTFIQKVYIARYQWQILYKFVGNGDLTQVVYKLLLNSNSFYRLFICITDNTVLSA